MKKQNVICVILSLTLFMIAMSASSFAITLLSKEEALAKMFPDVDEVVVETLTLTADEIAAVKERMGGSLVHYQDGSQSENVSEVNTISFHIGMKAGKKVSMAIIEEQPGKWGPVEFIVAIDAATAKIKDLAVMSYKEKRGRPIARDNFLNQFISKGSSDAISVRGEKGVRKDIRAVSGATISSDCACFATRKVIALYEEVFVKKLLAVATGN